MAELVRKTWTNRNFNRIGAGLALLSVAVPWYMGFSCNGQFLAYWLFQLMFGSSWNILVMAALTGGIVLSFFSRYGGILTLSGVLVFLTTFSSDQALGISYFGPPPRPLLSPGCQLGFYNLSEPYAPHVLGFWIAVVSGILTLVLAAPWNPRPFSKWQHKPGDRVES